MNRGLPPSLQGRVANGFSWSEQMQSMYKSDGGLFSKATFRSDDMGRSNRAFGEVMWQQANTKTALFGMLPKMTGEAPDNLSDPRGMNFRAVFRPPGMHSPDEGGDWGEPVDFASRQVELDPRHSTMLFESTLLQQVFADIQDNVPFDQITQIGEEYFELALETDGLSRPVESSTDSGVQYDADSSLTMLDRVIASEDEEANATDPNGTAYTDGDLDVYNIDRSDTGSDGDNEANWADSVVNHNSGALRQLTKSVIDETIESLEDEGANIEDLVIFTGNDTGRVISELENDNFRADAMVEAMSQAVGRGTDGAETRTGVGYQDRLSSYQGIPIVTSQNVPSDGLSRIFLLDMTTMQDPQTGENIPKLGIETYIPMTVETSGLGQQTNTLANKSLSEEYGILTTHELRCNRFNHQAKIRDLEE